MRSFSTSFTLLIVGAALVAGCGSSNRTESYSGLISKADAVCTGVNAKIAAAQQANKYDAVLKAGHDGIAKLKALKPPDKLKDAYATFLAKLDANEAIVKKLVAALDANDKATAQALSPQADAANKEVNAAASDVGLTVCSKD